MSKKSVKDTTRSTHDAEALPFAAINAGARRHRPPQQLGPVCGCSTPLNCTLVTVFYSASLKVANGEAAMHGRCMLGCQTAWIHQRARGSAASISPRLWRSRLILFRSDGLAHAHQGENEERHRQTEYDEGAKDTIALLLGRELGRAVGRAIESISRRQGVGYRWEVRGGGPKGVSSCQFWRTGGTQKRPVGGIAAAAALRLHLNMFAMEPRACSSDGVPGTAQPTFYVPPVLCVGLQLLLRHLARGSGARSTNWRIPAFGDSTRLRMCSHQPWWPTYSRTILIAHGSERGTCPVDAGGAVVVGRVQQPHARSTPRPQLSP